jgi:hypothetical protein
MLLVLVLAPRPSHTRALQAPLLQVADQNLIRLTKTYYR